MEIMEVSVITYKSNYTSSRQLHLITGGVPCQVIKSIRMQPTHSENFITITRAALKQDVAKNEFSNAHSNANLPCYILHPFSGSDSSFPLFSRNNKRKRKIDYKLYTKIYIEIYRLNITLFYEFSALSPSHGMESKMLIRINSPGIR